jgi:anthraniloyl-CoA monooxygenase
MEDAIELSNRLRTENEVREALAKFERNRRPVIEDYQAAAFQSMLWFENVSEHLSLRPMELAFAVMTRSGRMSFEDLRKRDPEFISRYEVERNS